MANGNRQQPIRQQQMNEPWSIDHKIPLTMIVTIAFQTMVAVWFISSLNSRVLDLEKLNDKTVTEQTKSIYEVNGVKERIVKLESTIQNINEKLDGISDGLKEIANRMTIINNNKQ